MQGFIESRAGWSWKVRRVVRGVLFIALVMFTVPGFALTVEQVGKLLPPEGHEGDFFGVSVAVSGNTAIVGAELVDGDDGKDIGAAYVFVKTDGVWGHQATLEREEGDANAGDRFGEWVAIDSNTVVVGALDDQETAELGGAVYVFVRTGSSWDLEQKLLASDGESGDRFGETVYIDGDTIGVGARFADQRQGAAYIFTRTGGVWTEQQKLVSPSPALGDWFGTQVAISGDTAIVGARTDDAPLEDSGAAYVFVRSGGSWNYEATLVGDGDESDEFGMAVDIDGDTAAVSAFKDDENGDNAGAIFVFTRTGMMWSREQKILATDDIPAFDELGTQVALQGNTLLAGGSLTRAAFLFTRAGGSWTQQAKITTEDALVGRFGTSVGLDGRTVVAGARLSIDNGSQSGSAFVFEFVPDNALDCLEDLISTVMSLNLQQGIENALDAKVQAALFALDDISNGNNEQAINMLVAFIQNAEAQRGTHLTDEQTDIIVNLAQSCIELLGG